jgi:thiamine-monophosphate kinase
MAVNPDPDKSARGELALIDRLRALCKPPTLAKIPFGDDMAGVDPSGLLATTDMLMDGVDFETQNQPLEAIGYKCLAVNLSDCAAMAAIPISALVSVALPHSWTLFQAERLYAGLQECAEQYQCPIVGGDTNSWDQPLVVCITVTGRPHSVHGPIKRDGARAGDSIYVSGQLGGSIRGRHLRPVPQIKLAQRLVAEHAPSP